MTFSLGVRETVWCRYYIDLDKRDVEYINKAIADKGYDVALTLEDLPKYYDIYDGHGRNTDPEIDGRIGEIVYSYMNEIIWEGDCETEDSEVDDYYDACFED